MNRSSSDLLPRASIPKRTVLIPSPSQNKDHIAAQNKTGCAWRARQILDIHLEILRLKLNANRQYQCRKSEGVSAYSSGQH